jgi:hypothetical protein
MTFVNAYEMSLERMIILAFLLSHARRRKETMIHPKKIHLPIVNGTLIVLLSSDSERILPAQ